MKTLEEAETRLAAARELERKAEGVWRAFCDSHRRNLHDQRLFARDLNSAKQMRVDAEAAVRLAKGGA